MIDDDPKALQAKLDEVRAALSGLRPTTYPSASATDVDVLGGDPIDPARGDTSELRLQLEAEERELEESLRAIR
jgi:hypothetical protein